MRILPVISRELRAQARQAFTYVLRVAGVLALLLGGLLFAVQMPFTPDLGCVLFGQMHRILFWSIWVLVPFSAADCISRERREGTLGLLFLTPLKPRHIVVAKGFAHGVRALTLLVAVLPAVTIPFLMGGVSWRQVAMVALVNFNSICWALGAALVASALTKNGLRAMMLAMVLACVAFYASTVMSAEVATANARGGLDLGRNIIAYVDFGSSQLFQGLVVLGVNPELWFPGSGVTRATMTNLGFYAGLTVIALMALLAAIVFAGNRIRHSWQEEPPSVRMKEFEKTFLQPVVWVSFFKRWMQRKLDANPVGWLEQRSWSGRTISWAWLGAIVFVYSLVLSDNHFMSKFGDAQSLMAWSLALTIAATSAASFRRERENGVLELLLVSPLSASEIVQGRLHGLWAQFFPACVAMLGIWAYAINTFAKSYYYSMHGESLVKVWFFAATFFVIPSVGLYFSVRCRNFISAFLMTVVVGMVLPMVFVGLVSFLAGAQSNQNRYGEIQELWRGIYAGSFLVQFILGSYLLGKLSQKLNDRSFPLERTI